MESCPVLSTSMLALPYYVRPVFGFLLEGGPARPRVTLPARNRSQSFTDLSNHMAMTTTKDLNGQ